MPAAAQTASLISLNGGACPAVAEPPSSLLQGTYDQLKQQVEAKNEVLKSLIDNFRHLLDAMVLWDAYKKELAAAG